MSATGVIALSACSNSPSKPSPGQTGASDNEVPVTPPEDLMREHGVLKRVLLIYREGIRRLQAGEQVPTQALNAGAGIIRSFIEDYHEHLEEQYVFPRLEQAAKLTDITPILRTQHQRGRVLTDRVLGATAGSATPDQPAREALVQDMSAFIRMYEPHEARERVSRPGRNL
jgi:hemerythrin-like domain-containing protein